MSKSKSQLDGDVYHPSQEVIEQARLKDWDELAEKAKALEADLIVLNTGMEAETMPAIGPTE